ncbi:MAG: methylated-DNA--[protein]-cysteine S-methyltransferase [Bacilli bacterium]|nr:methylated-DNA--[protein]-cysteine S-methyltransferase [Bacilli bacterium]
MKEAYFYETIIGKIVICSENNRIIRITMGDEIDDGYQIARNDIIKKTAKEINEYFLGRRKAFSAEYELQGTDFQMKVLQELTKIPYGETTSYKEIAIRIGSPKATRAVGMACNHNPLPLLIPCHRVIGASGKLVGFGWGLNNKKFLLNLEKQTKATIR